MSAPAVDPVLQVTLRAVLSLLFVSAAGHKLRDLAHFRAALAGYGLLPSCWIAPAAALLTAAEVGVAAGLWSERPALPALAGAGLLALYGAAIGTNLLRGRRDIDCGCAGPSRRQLLSGWLVARNGVLTAAALVSALPVAVRPLMWIDVVTIAASVAALALLYAGADGLLAHAPRIAALRHDGVERDASGPEAAHA